MIVIDASVLANAVGDDGSDGEQARQEVRAAQEIAAPDLVDVETVAVLRKRWLSKDISAARFAAAIDDLEDLDIDRYPSLRFMRRAFELRDNVTPYVGPAEALECDLLTADQRLAKAAGTLCTIRLLG